MKVVTNIDFNESRHTTKLFADKNSKRRAMMPFVPPTLIKKLLNNRSIVEAGRQLIALNWHSMKMVNKDTESQMTPVSLMTNHLIDIYLLQSPSKDKAVVYVIGSERGVRQLFIMYSGHPDIFYNDWMADLGLTELEIIGNALSYEEEAYDHE